MGAQHTGDAAIGVRRVDTAPDKRENCALFWRTPAWSAPMAMANAARQFAKEAPMAQRIRKGDLVQVIAGKERHAKKQGKVIEVDTERDRVKVAGVRIQKRHFKPGTAGHREGGIIEREGFIHVSNVQLVDTKDGKPSRVKIEERDGKRVRVFKKSGALVPAPAKN
jgi:large subunit ribosomal protein L24